MVLANGTPTTAWFEWGFVGGIFDRHTDPVNVGSGTSVVRLSAGINGLQAREVYKFRVVVSDGAATTTWQPLEFTTGIKVRAWGRNDSQQTTLPPGLSNVVAIAAGNVHGLALRAGGDVVAWGDNTYGQTNVPASLNNVVAVSAGGDHCLALKADGKVVAWGLNTSGQANVPAGLSNVVAIAAGGGHSLALKADGRLVGWGANNFGQRTVPAGLINVVAIAAGGLHSLAIKLAENMTVKGWGNNAYKQRTIPAGLDNAVMVSAGGTHSLALDEMGGVWAWGDDRNGQVADIPPWLDGWAVAAQSLAAGNAHSLALLGNGELVAWGDNTFDQGVVPEDLHDCVAVAAGRDFNLVLSPNEAPVATPLTIRGPANHDVVFSLPGTDENGDSLKYKIHSLPTAGTLYQCVGGARGSAILAAGTVVTDAAARVVFSPATNGCGLPYATFTYYLDDGEATSAIEMVTMIIGQGYPFTQSAGPVTSTSAVLRGMAVPNGVKGITWFEWGSRGGSQQATTPVDQGSGIKVVRVSETIGGLTSGHIYQYRLAVSNAAGVFRGAPQLFTTGKKLRAWGYDYYKQTIMPPGLSNVVAVAAGAAHNLALKADGKVMAWGQNDYGQTNVPGSLNNVVAVAAGDAHSLALQANGRVVAWGDNSYGQTSLPPGVTNIVAVAVGGFHSLALRGDGRVLAWGDNSRGQTNVPAGYADFVALAAGGFHSLAIRASGKVLAWGDDTFGQAKVPADLTDAVAVAGGGSFSGALRSDGGTVVWGENDLNGNLQNVLSLSLGRDHGMVLMADGVVMAAGDNTYRQLDIPPNLGDVAAIAAGGYHSLVICFNTPPAAFQGALNAFVNHDRVIRLLDYGDDLNGDALVCRIETLPSKGILYQYVGGTRGASITSASTPVEDTDGRVIFAPFTDLFNVADAFSFSVEDGEANSLPAILTLSIDLPAQPWPLESTSRVGTNKEINIWFGGSENAFYRVWASTNLLSPTWTEVGVATEYSGGIYGFSDLSTNLQRFYRFGAP